MLVCFLQKSCGLWVLVKTEEQSMDLESEIQNRKTEYEALEAKYRALEAEKLGIEQQLEDLRRENVELKERQLGSENKEGFGGAKRTERVVDLSEEDLDEDKFIQLMIENKVLECEKEKAERDVKAWESKFRELEAWLHQGLGSASEQRPLVVKSMGNRENVVDLVDVHSITHSPAKGIATPKAAGLNYYSIWNYLSFSFMFLNLVCKRIFSSSQFDTSICASEFKINLETAIFLCFASGYSLEMGVGLLRGYRVTISGRFNVWFACGR